MKKRIICLILSLLLVVGLLPLGLRANAAESMGMSQKGIDLLKEFEGFSRMPYWDYSQYTVGYGTRCPDEDLDRYLRDGITEAEAEALLRTYTDAIGRALNNFTASYGITLTQNQFDALAMFSFNCGTGWLYEEGQLRSAVLNGATGNSLIHPLTLWCNAGGSILTGLVRRRLCEANLYLNGVYSSAPPSNYGYVLYNGNGGTSSPRIQGYDTDLTAAILPTPTRTGYGFDGWYTAASGGSRVSVLDSGVKNRTLYAHWTEGGSDNDATVETGLGKSVSYRRTTTEGVNVYSYPDLSATVIDTLSAGSEVLIVEEYSSFGRINSSGWILLDSTKEVESNDNSISPVTVTVQNTEVNVRSGPGTNYSIVGSADKGDTMTITAVATGTGYTWGQFSKGWIALMYTNYDSVSKGNTEPTTPTTPSMPSAVATGTVTADSGLCVRSGPGTGYSVLSYLSRGDRVEITEQTTNGSMTWGKISGGWICMDYVKLDAGSATPPDSTKPTEPAPTAEPTTAPTTEPTTAPTTAPTEPVSSGRKGTVTAPSGLCVRSGPSTGYSVLDYLSYGDRVEILEQTTNGSMTWGRTAAGWVWMDYVRLDEAESAPTTPTTAPTTEPTTAPTEATTAPTEPAPTEPPAQETRTGTVVADGGLRIRSGPSTDYSIVGYLDDGDSVTIRETRNGWGRISDGWISLDYVRFENAAPAPAEPSESTGTVIADCLLVRSGAGLSNSVVGYLYYGEKVTYTETREADGMTWGKTSQGWISLSYVR